MSARAMCLSPSLLGATRSVCVCLFVCFFFFWGGGGGGGVFVLLARYGFGVKIGKDAQGRWKFTTSREREQGQCTLENRLTHIETYLAVKTKQDRWSDSTSNTSRTSNTSSTAED